MRMMRLRMMAMMMRRRRSRDAGGEGRGREERGGRGEGRRLKSNNPNLKGGGKTFVFPYIFSLQLNHYLKNDFDENTR